MFIVYQLINNSRFCVCVIYILAWQSEIAICPFGICLCNTLTVTVQANVKRSHAFSNILDFTKATFWWINNPVTFAVDVAKSIQFKVSCIIFQTWVSCVFPRKFCRLHVRNYLKIRFSACYCLIHACLWLLMLTEMVQIRVSEGYFVPNFRFANVSAFFTSMHIHVWSFKSTNNG